MLNVFMLSPIMLNVIVLSPIMLYVIMLSVVMISVMLPVLYFGLYDTWLPCFNFNKD